MYCVSYWSTFSDLACGVSCSCVTSPINHKMGEDAQLLLCGLEEVSDVGGGLWCWSDQNTAIVMVMMMIVRWYGLVGFEQETWYEEKERAIWWCQKGGWHEWCQKAWESFRGSWASDAASLGWPRISILFIPYLMLITLHRVYMKTWLWCDWEISCGL